MYGQNPQGELAFFDRVKKTLENGGTYEEFLKLLNLFTRDIINLDNLMDRADVFLDPELMRQFKDLMGWEERYSGIDNGPPGSLRTSAPDHMAPQFPDDGQGPSYRRLPETVSLTNSLNILPATLLEEHTLIRMNLSNRRYVWRVQGVTNWHGRSLMTSGFHTQRGLQKNQDSLRIGKPNSKKPCIESRKNAMTIKSTLIACIEQSRF